MISFILIPMYFFFISLLISFFLYKFTKINTCFLFLVYMKNDKHISSFRSFIDIYLFMKYSCFIFIYIAPDSTYSKNAIATEECI